MSSLGLKESISLLTKMPYASNDGLGAGFNGF